jgi:hypothetical protein
MGKTTVFSLLSPYIVGIKVALVYSSSNIQHKKGIKPMQNRKINLRLRRANTELRAFMKENGMNFDMTLKTFLEMVVIWSEEQSIDPV